MLQPRTVDDVLRRQVRRPGGPLPSPTYNGSARGRLGASYRLGLTTVINKTHMTDEAHQLFQAVADAGLAPDNYCLAGYGMADQTTEVGRLIDHYNPLTVLVQDQREWEGLTADKPRDLPMRFTNVELLTTGHSFVGTVLKDAQNNNEYHRQSAKTMGAHFWVVYYHPRIVSVLAPFVRPQHLIRTYHTLDPALVPEYSAEGRHGCIVSGALGGAYPLRTRLVREYKRLPDCTWHQHPGYHRRGCETPRYLRRLSQFKVAVCTSSVYGYALRKLVEATAAGCVVLTDLPTDEVMPEIDDNLVRVHPDEPTAMIAERVRQMLAGYDPDRQRRYAWAAKTYYDYRAEGRRLADRIEYLRRNYDAS